MARPAVPSRRVIVLLVATAVALMTIDVRGFGPLSTARRAVLTATQPVRDGISWAASPIVDGWNGAVHYDQVVEENALLRQRVAELEGAIEQLPDTELELRQVLAAADIEYVGDVPRVTARVVSDRRTGLERIIEIDRGSADGIEEDQPVITGEGLVGRVLLATENRSVIRLITDPRFSVGLVSPSTGALGVATGDGDGSTLVMDIEAAGMEDAATGERFETSGFDRSRYPGGVPVGTLVVDDDLESLRLVPSADLSQLAYVSVLLVPEAS